MALTSNEEALVRQMLAQQQAILNLAGSEPTIMSKLGATKVTLSDLAAATSLAVGDLLLTRQGTSDKSVAMSVLQAFFANTFLQKNNDTAALAAGSTMPTAPQFDNDTTIASTAFVQRALGNLSGFASYNGAGQTIAATDVGKLVIYGPTAAGQTITLPDTTQLPYGSVIVLRGYNGTSFNVAAKPGQDFICQGVILPSIQKVTTQTLVLAVEPSTRWNIIGGSIENRYSMDFYVSQSNPWYFRLPNGVMIQGGEGSASSSAPWNITLPVAFPSVFAACIAMAYTNSGTAPAFIAAAEKQSQSLSNLVVRTNNSGPNSISWLAIGW